ncbi:hypothetical protein G7Y89_g225 [Cudoniella acicularis]|uniref:Uncharacterized protein n=1 Tax=Cudoniella acicularis TaxID=354080 RepID=A0A8H4RXM2_9HELO|nr:hypothetical protein G7Y89_g225 [Cudoniella acicularis]
MISGIFLEILGYIARTWMHKAIFNKNPFIMNLVCLTIAPVFFTAALYITLGRVIVHYGPQHSRLTPRMYSLIFMTSDVIALLLQSVGGAIADNASTDSGETFGTNIMVAGLASQLISLSCFLILASEFFWKVSVDRKARNATNWASKSIDRPPPDKEFFKLFLVGYGCATLLILARSIFRTAELAHGFRGSLANNELAFMVLEGGMIIFATLTMTILHPAEFIGEKWKESGWGINKNDQPAGEMRKASLDEDAHELREDVYMRPWPAPVGPLGPISAPIPIPNYVPETMPDRF